MVSPKASTTRAFTLIETLIVIGLLSAVAAFSVYAGLSDYQGSASRAEAQTIIMLLQKARADALNNIDSLPHGLAIFPADDPHAYVLFEGESYAASDPKGREAYPASYELTPEAASLREVVFSPHSGTACCDGEVLLTDPTRGVRRAISINREGLID